MSSAANQTVMMTSAAKMTDPMGGEKQSLASRTAKMLTSRIGSFVAVVIAFLWTIPTFGLFVSSFRPEAAIKTTGWWTLLSNPEFTMDNYRRVLGGSTSGESLSGFFMNSIVITVPATLLPLALATMAAYALSVLRWKGRDWVFVAIFALQIVPLQMSLIPLMRIFTGFAPVAAIVNQFPFFPVWIAHTIFALPLAVFLLHNFMGEVPRELLEAARVDGAGHVTLFFKVLLPLMLPAIASFGIFQFRWVWNDLLVGLTFTGGSNVTQPMTAALSSMAGSRGQEWHLLTAGAFISMLVPLIVFISLQKYFVRGLLAGSVKG